MFTMKELVEKLENNSFIDKVRMNLEFNVKDYQELLKILNEIKHYTYNHNLIEKRLASNLYEIPIELFPLFIIKIKNISNWLELINKPNFYCLKFFSHKIDKVIDISLLDNEEDVLSISIGVNA